MDYDKLTITNAETSPKAALENSDVHVNNVPEDYVDHINSPLSEDDSDVGDYELYAMVLKHKKIVHQIVVEGKKMIQKKIETESCPYNPYHVINADELKSHLANCPNRDEPIKIDTKKRDEDFEFKQWLLEKQDTLRPKHLTQAEKKKSALYEMCPYNPSHICLSKNIKKHIQKCPMIPKNVICRCPYNRFHIVPKTKLARHCRRCPCRPQP